MEHMHCHQIGSHFAIHFVIRSPQVKYGLLSPSYFCLSIVCDSSTLLLRDVIASLLSSSVVLTKSFAVFHYGKRAKSLQVLIFLAEAAPVFLFLNHSLDSCPRFKQNTNFNNDRQETTAQNCLKN